MQIDFHFYAASVLARAAGFNPVDALIIGYASQYTDDATESKPIPLNIRGQLISFDPTCTAYSGLQYLKPHALNWSTQKRVYIPFHFLPPKAFRPHRQPLFDFVTQADSSFARQLLTDAINESVSRYNYRLCRIGVILHAFADSWAHQGFSGRRSPKENAVAQIEYRQAGRTKYKPIHPLEKVFLAVAPVIGHAEAGFYPDLAYADWRYRRRHSDTRWVYRDNVTERLVASATIHELLSLAAKNNPAPVIPWLTLKPTFQKLLATGPSAQPKPWEMTSAAALQLFHALQVEERCQLWRNQFRHLFEVDGQRFLYDKGQWRRDALDGFAEWDGYSDKDWAGLSPIKVRPDFWDSLWVQFHRAALHQRHLVLESLP
jgi:hypothetical protein